MRQRCCTAILTSFLTLSAAGSAPAGGVLFTEDFESYDAGSNLTGQGGWAGTTNFGTTSQIPVEASASLGSGQALDTRAITEADRFHAIGHALAALDPAEVSVLSVDAFALADSVNTAVGIGENPSPGPEFVTAEGFFSTWRFFWGYDNGWYFDFRGIAGVDDGNLYRTSLGTGEKVTLRIVVDGPAGLAHGQLVDGDDVTDTPTVPITPSQITALDGVALYSDRSLPGRNGAQFDNFRFEAVRGADLSPCGDVNRSGKLTSSDALAVLKAAVGQAANLQCPPRAQPLRTGQVDCHNTDGTPLSCLDSGQDGELQRGASRGFTDQGDGTVTDEATGLVWEKLSRDGSVHDVDLTYDWPGAFGKIADLNKASFAGQGDWRLPNVRELETLRDLDTTYPATPEILRAPCTEGVTVLDGSCTSSSYYWTSTTWLANPAVAWVVLFETGTVDASLKNTQRHVRAVRGGW